MADVILTSKYCRKCLTELPIMAFAKSSTKKDGLQCWCKSCRKQYRLDNIERYKENDRKAYFEKSDYYKSLAAQQRLRLGKDGIKKYNSQYWIKNKERLSADSKEWRDNNQDHLKNYRKNIYSNNKEKFYQRNKKQMATTATFGIGSVQKTNCCKKQCNP